MARRTSIIRCPRPRRTALPASRKLPFSMKVLLENLLRHEDGRTVTKADIEDVAAWLDRQGQGRQGDRLPPRPRADAGLHRRARRRRPRRDARRHEARSAATRQKINPLVPVDLVIDHSVIVDEFGSPQALAQQRRARVSSATASATTSSSGARARSTTSASCRPAPASATRSTSSTWRRPCGRAPYADGTIARLSRHARRHRQPHHHGQRPRRARLGRRRHRGGGRHARPAAVDAAFPRSSASS